MGQTLTNGIYLPNEGERNCYSGLAANWNAVDTLKGNYSLHAINVDIHVTATEKETWNGKADASALTAHTGDTTIHVTAEDKATWNGKADASALTAHTGDTTIHVTAEDKQAWDGHVADSVKHVTAEDKATWNGKQDALSQTQLDAVNSGIDSTKVQQIVTNTSNISSLQSGKANDSNVVHKSGNEIIGGVKTFSNDIRISKTSPFCNVFSGGYIKGQAPTSNIYSGVRIFDDINSGSTNNITGGFEIEYNRDGYNKSYIATRNYAGENHKLFTVGLRVPNDDIRSIDFFPSVSDIVNLGTSTNKWKSFNGINPGALSLPDYSTRIDISSYVTNLSGAQNAYTPSVDGWIAIQSSNATFIRIADTGSGGLGNTVTSQTAGTLTCMIPVRANRQNNIYIVCTTLTSAYFIPCQGNV